MSEEVIGSPTIATGEVGESQEVSQGIATPPVSGEQNPAQSQGDSQRSGTVDDIPGLISRAERAEAESRRQREYNEFLRQTRDNVAQPKERKEFDPDAIPYVRDVNDLIDMRVEERLNAIQEERVVDDLRRTSDSMRGTDPNFDRRMNMAREILERDEMLVPLFLREKTADGKIAFMERIAQWHPLYDGSLSRQGGAPVSQSQMISEAAQKLKAATQVPPALSSIPASGTAQKLVSQMTDDEYVAYFKSVTKGY